MRKYELVCLIQPDLDEAAFNGVLDRVKGWVTESGGSVDKVDMWGKRRLAYAIRKQRESNYVLFNLSLETTATAGLGAEPALHRNGHAAHADARRLTSAVPMQHFRCDPALRIRRNPISRPRPLSCTSMDKAQD